MKHQVTGFLWSRGEDVGNRRARHAQSHSVDQRQLTDTISVARSQLRGEPATEGQSSYVRSGQAEVVHQIGVMEHQVFHGIDLFQPFGLAKPRVRGQIDREVLRQQFEERQPHHLTTSAVQIEQGIT